MTRRPTARSSAPSLIGFQPNEKIRKFLQVYHGLALTGMTGQQCFIYNHGTGANGKSTCMEAVASLFGPYSDLLNAESLTGAGQRRGDQATPDFADLPGVRYLRISELPRGEPLKEALVKALTGGEEIKARHLNKGFFKFTPCFKAAMSGNDLPTIGGVDNGIWRRVRLVPWEVIIPEGERRPMNEVLAEFEAERSGILNWLIEGLDLFMREGLSTPDEVTAATAAYRAEMDPISSFTNDCLERGRGAFRDGARRLPGFRDLVSRQLCPSVEGDRIRPRHAAQGFRAREHARAPIPERPPARCPRTTGRRPQPHVGWRIYLKTLAAL